MSYIYNLTDTWNNVATTFTAIGMNVTDTTSAAGSALIDLQVAGVSQFKVSKAGAVTAVGVAIPTISSTDTLSNKTLSSPTVSGTIAGAATWSGIQTFSPGANDTVINRSDTNPFHLSFRASGTVRGYIGADATNGLVVYNSGLTKALSWNASTGVLGGDGFIASSGSVTALSAIAIPAGGTTGAGLMVSSTANFGVFFGSGAPTLSAAKGSLYMRSDGSGINDRMYVNTNGSTTWTAVITAA